MSASLSIKLDDELFERLVERRWEDEVKPTSDGVDSEGFLRIYSLVLTPATVFGQHLRKAAGRGDESISEHGPKSSLGEGATTFESNCFVVHCDGGWCASLLGCRGSKH